MGGGDTYIFILNGNYILRSFGVFFAAIESVDIPRILSQQGGEAVYPIPRTRALEVHPKLNLAALLSAVKSAHLYCIINCLLISVV